MYPIPRYPTNILCVKVRQVNPSSFPTQEFITDYLFDIQPPLPIGAFPHAASFDTIANWMYPVYVDLCSLDTANPSFWLIYDDGTTNHCIYAAPATFPHSSYFAVSTMVCPCFTRRTGVAGPSGRGRVFGPPVPQNFIDGNHYTPTALASYENSAIAQALPWSFCGRSAIPVVWSRVTNSINYITQVDVIPSPRVIRKRRPLGSYARTPIVYPIVP